MNSLPQWFGKKRKKEETPSPPILAYIPSTVYPYTTTFQGPGFTEANLKFYPPGHVESPNYNSSTYNYSLCKDVVSYSIGFKVAQSTISGFQDDPSFSPGQKDSAFYQRTSVQDLVGLEALHRPISGLVGKT